MDLIAQGEAAMANAPPLNEETDASMDVDTNATIPNVCRNAPVVPDAPVHPAPVADPVVNANDFQTILALAQQQMQAINTLIASNGGAPLPDRAKPVRAVDVDLDKFSGGPKSAHVVHADNLLKFDRWFRMSVHRMDMYALPATQQAPCLISHLDGPAANAWFAAYPNERSMSVQQFYDHFCTLIPQCKLYCTNKYTNMAFSPSTLVEDVEDYMSYVRFSGALVDANTYHEVLCDLLYQKIARTCPRVLETARSCYGIELKATDSLQLLSQNIQAAARRYYQEYGRDVMPSRTADHTPARHGKKRKSRDRTPQPPGPPRNTPTETDEQILTRLGRCMECGFMPAAGQIHACHKDKLAVRIAGIKATEARGGDANAFPKPFHGGRGGRGGRNGASGSGRGGRNGGRYNN